MFNVRMYSMSNDSSLSRRIQVSIHFSTYSLCTYFASIEDTTDADFIRYGAELKELAQTQHVLLVMSQFLNLRDRCIAVANVHDQLSLIALFAELLDEEFRRRKRRSTDLHVFPLSVSRFRRRVMEADRLRSLSFPRFPPRHNRDIYEYVSTFIRDVPPSKLALWPS